MEIRQLEDAVYEKDGGIARIILDNSDQSNMQTEAMVWSVDECLDDAQYDYDIKVVIIKANGDGFCSGHDPSGKYPSFIEERESGGGTWRGPARLFLWPVLKLWEFPKPTIAQVHGYCIGGGTTWGLLPDITICADDAWFQMPMVQSFGLPGLETSFEPWVYMNYKRAAEYLFTAKRVEAAEALDHGLVNRVVPRDELEATVEEMAATIARAPTITLQAAKMNLTRAWETMGFRTHQQSSNDLQAVVSHNPEFRAFIAELIKKVPLERMGEKRRNATTEDQPSRQ